MYEKTLSDFLGRPLTPDEARLMEVELTFQAGGLTNEMLATAERLSEEIRSRKDVLRAMPAREQYRYEGAIGSMLNAMEGFYLFGGMHFVQEKGIRATHPWGAVLYPLYGTFNELGEMHSPLLARKMYEMHVGNVHEAAGRKRWSRLDSVKEWAFEQRRADPAGARAPVIRRIAGQVRAMAKDAGEPLSGDDQAVIRTITGWFRDASIK